MLTVTMPVGWEANATVMNMELLQMHRKLEQPYWMLEYFTVGIWDVLLSLKAAVAQSAPT